VLCLALTSAIGEWRDPVTEFRRGDYRLALRLFSERATHCEAQAQNYLGIMYHLGLGTGRDAHSAVRWFRQAAANGDAAAQRNLGTLYGQGHGVRQNHFKAYVWLLLAEWQGNQAATVALGAMSDKLTANQIMRARARAAKYARTRSHDSQGLLHHGYRCVVQGH
jgi:TPR repeat protein